MKGFLCIVLFLSGLVARAQYPSFFQYSVENGTPSNEIYWLYEDYDGYLWIGCDAGLFKFNGVSYEHSSSSELTARAVTGIIQSKRTGRIYAYNFNRQLICIEKNKLRVIKTWNRPINGLADDHKGNIFITSSEGTFKMEESNFSIDEVHSKLHFHDSKGRTFSSHGISDPSGVVYYQSGNRLMIWQNGIPKALPLGTNSENSIVFFSRFSRYPFVVSFTGGQVMRIVNKNLIPYSDAPLTKALKGRKINCVFESRDGKVWIGTYSGLVCHDPKKKSTEIFYTQFSFSYGIEDSEGNLWFSTLHNGFIRVANLNVRYWTTRDRFGLPDQYNLISFDERSIYFGSTNGMLGKLNVESSEFQKKEHSPKADFGMLYADTIDKCLYFNKNGQIFRFQKDRFQLVNKSGRPVKSLFHSPSGYFFLSSQGLFFASSVNDHLTEDRMIDRVWYREMCASPFSKTYFAASNEGLVELEGTNGVCRVVQRFSKTKQILSLSPDLNRQLIYFLSFDGRVYSVNKAGKIQLVLKIEKEFRATQLRCHGNKIYIATNKGILTFEPSTRRQLLFDRFSGLISNNITSIAFKDGYCWTVGEGIHKIPLSEFNSSSGFSRIRLLRIQVNKVDVAISNLIEINHDDEVAIFMDGKCYRSNDDFEFAYQLNGSGNTWRKFPGSLQSIDFSSLPSGIVRIDIKIIDHQGNDSLNQVHLKFYVHPPFWQRWWFYVLVAFTTLLMAVVIFRLRLKVIQKKQMLELKRLKLENELRLTQQSALKAQMNPHFLFNVLNSIKGYIYENDKGNAAKYLSEFSNLVRKVLELSSVPTVPLDEELEALNLYINLEAMLLQNDFEYKLNIEDGIDLSGIHLPALLLQPYVENAFKHGLRHKVGQKILEISVRMDHEEQLLIIEVTDNGIGRKAADELNMQNRSEHQSFGNSAIEKRIKLLNFKRKDVVGVEIRDNFKENQSSGTTVIIQIHV